MSAPDIIVYTDQQVRDHGLDSRLYNAVDIDDDEGATLGAITVTYDRADDGLHLFINVEPMLADRVRVTVNSGTVYDEPDAPETVGISATAVAGAVRKAFSLRGNPPHDGNFCTFKTIDQVLRDLGV